MGFDDSTHVEIPDWAHCLYGSYWRIRVEGKNKALQRKYYRRVEKLKLQLVEAGHDLELVEAICSYMSTLKKTSAVKLRHHLAHPTPQLRLF